MEKKIKFQRNHGKSFAILFGKKVELWCSAWSHTEELKVKSVQAVLLPTIRIEYTPSSINFDEYRSFSVMFGFLFWYAKLDIISKTARL